jgi:hypothetical protein
MAREGEGEKLEAIAAEERLPATRIRQRVSRMRRWMKEQWIAELGAVATLAGIAFVVWWLGHHRETPEVNRPEPSITFEPTNPAQRARAIRDDALLACGRQAWRDCLEGLDRAKALDAQGDEAPTVRAARAQANENLRVDAPAPTSSSVPVPSAAPKPIPMPKHDLLKGPWPQKTPDTKPVPKSASITPDATTSVHPQSPNQAVSSPDRKASSKVLDPEMFGSSRPADRPRAVHDK